MRQVSYQVDEVCALTGLSSRVVKCELRHLERASLVVWREDAIVIQLSVLKGSEETIRQIAGKRSWKRPIPIPRKVFRFIAAAPKSALGKTILAYCLRGLVLRRTGEIQNAGSVKAGWIATAYGLSLRSVRSARKSLINLEFIGKDTGSFQRKLNRDGAYFKINLAWTGGSTVSNKIAPRSSKKEAIIAPPYKDKKTSYESKNQKTQRSAPNLPGVCKANEFKKPILSKIRIEDLKSFSQLQVLRIQAIRAGWIADCESDTLLWYSAAVRVITTESDDPVRVFVAIVRKRLWKHINQDQEDRARKAIVKHQGGEEKFHAFKESTEAVGVCLSRLNLYPRSPQKNATCSTAIGTRHLVASLKP